MSFLFTGDFCSSKYFTQTNKHYCCGPAKPSGTSKGQHKTKPWGAPHLGSEVSELSFPIWYQVNEKPVLNASFSGSWFWAAAVQQVKSQLWLLCWAQHSGNRELCLPDSSQTHRWSLSKKIFLLKSRYWLLNKAKIFILPALPFTWGFRNMWCTAGETYEGIERNIKENRVFFYPKANIVLSGLHSSHFFKIRTVFKRKSPSLLSYSVILNMITS